MSLTIDERTKNLLRGALAEDVGGGDVTSLAIFPPTATSRAEVITKEALVVCGHDVAYAVCHLFDASIVYRIIVPEGVLVPSGTAIAEIAGSTLSVLHVERTVLNFLQRLSAIATTTRRIAESVKQYGVQILDTRKTTPGWRVLEKHAVHVGGGTNHRMGLFDQVLIKNNHIDALNGDVEEAIRRCRKAAPRGMKIEVEVRNEEELDAALREAPDMVLLDNMSPEDLKRLVEKVRKTPGREKTFLEASGGITEATIGRYAASGVDAISLGLLTHSVRACDISLRHREDDLAADVAPLTLDVTPFGAHHVVTVDRWLARGVRHGFLAKDVDVKDATDPFATVAEQVLGEPVALYQLRQVHGTHAVRSTMAKAGSRSEWCEGDAWIVDGLPLGDGHPIMGIRTADCVPVILLSSTHPRAALVHCGWRGTVSRAMPRIVQSLLAEGVNPARLEVAIGPAAGICCYEVGEEVVKVVDDEIRRLQTVIPMAVGRADIIRPTVSGKSFLGLTSLIRLQLIAEGVLPERIVVFRGCTICDERFASYRREGDSAGRQLSFLSAADVVAGRALRSSERGPGRVTSSHR